MWSQLSVFKTPSESQRSGLSSTQPQGSHDKQIAAVNDRLVRRSTRHRYSSGEAPAPESLVERQGRRSLFFWSSMRKLVRSGQALPRSGGLQARLKLRLISVMGKEGGQVAAGRTLGQQTRGAVGLVDDSMTNELALDLAVP
ncbi:hypothetical protein NL676_007106 [Syzygium grande]|nr:hypothetical protein NL676_007106 [Syzygium grande]